MSDINSDETSAFVATSSDMPEAAPAAAPEANAEEAKAEEPKAEEAKPEADKAEGDQDSDPVKSGESNDSDATAEQDKPKKAKSAQKRIDAVVREREEAKRRAEAAEKRLAELEAKQNEEKKPGQQSKEPVESDFETYDDYLTALDQYDASTRDEPKGDEPAKEDDQNGESNELTDAQRTAMGIIGEKTVDAAEKHPDFEKVALAPDVPITGDMLEALAGCDDPATVMMHLGNNKDLAAEIAGKSPAQQMREIAKLDLTVEYTPPKPIKTTQAADPIEPVSGSDAQQKPVQEMSFAEHEAYMNEQERKSSGSRW